MVYAGGLILIVGLVGAILFVVGFVAVIATMTWDLLSDRGAKTETETATEEATELSAA